MVKLRNIEEARKYARVEADKFFEKGLDANGFGLKELEDYNDKKLRVKLNEIEIYIFDRGKAEEKFGEFSFLEDEDYILSEINHENIKGFIHTAYDDLINRKKEIFELIKRKETEKHFKAINELASSISQDDLKRDITIQLNELKEKEKQYEEEEKEIDEEAKNFDREKKEIEIKKDRLDLFDKKSQIWLRILARESIASILGAIILFVMTISLIIAMFAEVQITNIVESAFLLILGYFFGQAVSKK